MMKKILQRDGKQDEYLSGNVREKVKAGQNICRKQTRVIYEKCVGSEKVQPKDLDASEIDVRLGTTWVEIEDIENSSMRP